MLSYCRNQREVARIENVESIRKMYGFTELWDVLQRYGMWQVTRIDRSSQISCKIQEYTVVQRFIKDDRYYQSGKWQETIVARRNIEMT